MSDFNLRQLVRDVLTASTMADPRDLASEVFRRIDPDDYAAALTQCLPDIVREQIRASRNRVDEVTLELEHAPATEVPVMAEMPGPVGRTKQRPVKSAKVAGIRDWWQTKLRERVHIGSSEWRLLGDCTFADLMFAAQERRSIAAANSVKASEYAGLAEALQAHGVERVRDLPADALRARLEGEAA